MTVNSIHHPVLDEVIASSIRGVAAVAAPIAIVVGLLVLIGWWLEIDWLKSVYPGLVSMKANTAAAFVLCGVALAAVRSGSGAPARHVARTCAGVVSMIGMIVLAEYATGFSTGLDRLLFHEAGGAVLTPVPGRMSPGSAVGFLCCGASLLLFDVANRCARSASQWLALVPIAVGYVGIVDYLFTPGPLFPGYGYTPIALHAAVVFALMGIGLLGARPERGFMAMATGATAGGVVLRRLLPAVAVFVPGAFWFKHQGIRFGWYEHDAADMLLLITSVLALVAMVCWSALWLTGSSGAGAKPSGRRPRSPSARLSPSRSPASACGSGIYGAIGPSRRTGCARCMDCPRAEVADSGNGLPRSTRGTARG